MSDPATAGLDIFNAAYLHSQVFWTGVSFAFMALILVWKVLPAVTQALDARADKIRGDLSTAEEKRREAEAAMAEYTAKLAKAKEEAMDIVNTARNDAKAMVDARMGELERDIAKRREAAQEAIEATKAQAMKDLQSQVAEIAVQVTEKLLAIHVDTKKAEAITDKAVKDLMH
ncbi:MAG: F0F1 ATP synthase subunit B [Alphaproteobacteria bacterium]